MRRYRKPLYPVSIEIIIPTLYHLKEHIKNIEAYKECVEIEFFKKVIDKDIKEVKEIINYYDNLLEEFIQKYSEENQKEDL